MLLQVDFSLAVLSPNGGDFQATAITLKKLSKMSGILQCFYELCGFVSDKQSSGAVKVVQKHQKIHRGEEEKQPPTNENQYLLDEKITIKPAKENKDSISKEVEAKLGPSSDSDYKTSESPVHTDDAKPEVPSLLTVQQDEVRYCLFSLFTLDFIERLPLLFFPNGSCLIRHIYLVNV